jgi:hypothetical protein
LSPPDGGEFSRAVATVFLVCDVLLVILRWARPPTAVLPSGLRIIVVSSPIPISIIVAYALNYLPH